MKSLDIRELIGGLVLVVLGLFVAVYASSHYQVGEVARMGPGFFPTLLGWVLAGLGAIIILLAFGEIAHVLKPPPFQLRPFISIVGAVTMFSLLVERLGLVPTTVIVVFIAAMAERGFRVGRAIVLGIVLAILAWLIFTVGLQMTLPAFAFLG